MKQKQERLKKEKCDKNYYKEGKEPDGRNVTTASPNRVEELREFSKENKL